MNYTHLGEAQDENKCVNAVRTQRFSPLFLFYAAPVVLWMGVVFLASTQIGAEQVTLRGVIHLIKLLSPEQAAGIPAETFSKINFVVRKCAHISEYAVLCLLAMRAIQFGASRLKWQSPAGALALCVCYAASDEFHQIFVPGRTAAIRDVVIDCTGAVFALLCALLWFGCKAAERRLWQKHDANSRLAHR